MWTESPSPVFLAVIAASAAAHVAALALLAPASAATAEAPRPPATITFEVTPPPPPPPPPAATAEPEPERVAARAPQPRTQRPATRRPRAAEPTVTTAPPPPGPAAPADLSGLTLTNEGATWSAPSGDGSPLTGPIAAPAPRAAPGPRTAGETTGPRVVAAGDLSRPPRAPDLDAALAANYPPEARRAGLTGKALVRARIQPDGSVGAIRLVSESAPGFGTACKRTLTGSRWDPPLDVRRDRVATDVSYTCTFAVVR